MSIDASIQGPGIAGPRYRMESIMEHITRLFSGLDEWFSRPLFQIGSVEISLSRLAVALLIIGAAWWLSSRLERAVRGLSARGKRTRMSTTAAYALGRIVRYV